MSRLRVICIVSVLAIAAMPVLAEHEHEDLVVGVTSGNQLAIEFGHWDEAHELPVVSGLLSGWAGDHPGFAHLEEDEPGEGFFKLGDGVEVWLEVISFETGFKAYDGGFSGGPYSNVGDQAYIGDDHLHSHLEWHIDPTTPGFDELDGPWEATFKLIDKGNTGYLPSENYTLSFVPEPASFSVMMIGVLVLFKRKK